MVKNNDLKNGLNELLSKRNNEKKPSIKPVPEQETRPTNRAGRKSRINEVADNDMRTSLVLDRNLYQQINQIAVLNNLTYKDVMNAAMRSLIERYEQKHGPLSPRESNISADELI